MKKIRKQLREEIKKLKALKKRVGRKLTVERFRELTNQPELSEEKAKEMIKYIEEFADIIAPQFLQLQKMIQQKIPVRHEKRIKRP